MNRTILITSIVTGVACCAAFVLRAINNSKLQTQIEEQHAIVSQLETQGNIANREKTNTLSALQPRRDRTAEAIARVRAATTTGQRIDRAHNRINALIGDLGNIQDSPDKLFRILPDVLRLLKDLDMDEMIAVSDKIDAPLAFGREGGGQGAVKLILLLLAGEQDPKRILDKIEAESEGPTEAVVMALGALARKDPGAAMRWIDGADLKDSEKSELGSMISIKALNSDFDSGLEILRQNEQMQLEQTIGLLSQIPLERSILGQAAAALRKPENADLKPAMVNMVLNSTFFHAGVKGAREAAENYRLPDEEVAAFLENTGDRFGQSDPAGMIEWMLEIQSADQQAESIPGLITGWARRDYNAAGNFLGKMEASPVRDLATERFAKIVATLDPKAAAIWALEIDDADRRQTTIQAVSDEWREQDHAAASAWFEEQGIELE